MALAINNTNFEEVLASGKPVVIDFWAEWCGPCRAIGPVVDELADEYKDRVIIGKCDVAENDDIAMQYQVRGIPTLIFCKDGVEIARLSGIKRDTFKEDMKEQIEKLL